MNFPLYSLFISRSTSLKLMKWESNGRIIIISFSFSKVLNFIEICGVKYIHLHFKYDFLTFSMFSIFTFVIVVLILKFL